MRAGVDMVHLTTPEFRVLQLQGRGFRIKSGAMAGEVPEPFGVTAAGEPLQAPGYYVNGEAVRVDVDPRGVYLKFNPSKALHPYELLTDPKGMDPVLDTVRRELDTLGLQLDLDGSKLARVDLTKQAVMDQPAAAFGTAFAMLRGKRMTGTAYPDGYTFSNSRRKAVFYDKRRELLNSYPDTDAPDNLLRAEVRWTHPKAVGDNRQGLGIGTLSALREADPDQLSARFNRFLNSSVFRLSDGDQLSLDFAGEVDTLRAYREAHPRGGWQRYILTEGAEVVLLRFGSYELLRQALLAAGWSRSQTYTIIDQLRTAMQRKAFMDTRRKRTTVARVIDQLRHTFAA